MTFLLSPGIKGLKLADVTPVFKKKDPLGETNYRPVSVFPPFSKIFERLLHEPNK